jgi:nicotinic acid phosphoribosyltransferase
MDTLAHWFHLISEVLDYINPFMMMIALFMWIKLYFSVQSQCNKMYMRQYVLEKQVDYLASTTQIDPKYLNMLRKTYDGFKV